MVPLGFKMSYSSWARGVSLNRSLQGRTHPHPGLNVVTAGAFLIVQFSAIQGIWFQIQRRSVALHHLFSISSFPLKKLKSAFLYLGVRVLPEDLLLLMVQGSPFDLSCFEGIKQVEDSDAVVEEDAQSLPFALRV